MSDLAYVYAIVPASIDISRAPSGLDDRPVSLERSHDVGALLSLVAAADYDPSVLETRTADLGWLGPRARAHDLVQTWGSDLGPLVPLAMFALFRDVESVRRMLDRRRAEFERALAHSAKGREFAVRVFRLTTEVERSLTSWSPAIAALDEEAERASPGQQYLLRRKLAGARAEEVRRRSAEVAQRVHETLGERAMESTRTSIPAASDATRSAAGDAILDASFFVAHENVDSFRAALTALVAEWEPRGFRFEFTGPWPPYHFAGIAPDD